MATPLSNFFPEIFIVVPSVADRIAEHYLRNACIEFCQTSTYVRSDLVFNTVVDQATYVAGTDFTIPAESRVAEIYDGTYGTRNHILRKTPGQLESEVGFDWRIKTGNVDYVTRETADSLRLVRIPEAVIEVTITAAYKPTQTATSVDDSLYDDYHEEIAAGALARLFNLKGADWHDPQQAGMYGGQFASGIQDAKRRVENAFFKPTRTVQYGGI